MILILSDILHDETSRLKIFSGEVLLFLPGFSNPWQPVGLTRS